MAGAPTRERRSGVAQERLREQKARIGANAELVVSRSRRQHLHRRNAEVAQEPEQLIFDHIGKRAHDQQLLSLCRRQIGNHRGQACVLALR